VRRAELRHRHLHALELQSGEALVLDVVRRGHLGNDLGQNLALGIAPCLVAQQVESDRDYQRPYGSRPVDLLPHPE
jgi:hypothetical protein